MNRVAGFVALALSVGIQAPPQGPCAQPPAGTGPRFFIEQVAVTARDTVTSVRLCLAPGAKGVGSYMASIGYDTARARVVRVETVGGMQAANPRAPGVIRIAGASPAGFGGGLLATIQFSRRGPNSPGRLILNVSEASTTSGASLTGEITAAGWPATAPGTKTRPAIDSISPRAGEVGPDRVTDIVVFGKGFAASGNTVVFGGADVTGLLSERNGTVIRFGAPATVPANGGASRRVEAGRVEVRVRHGGGTSNAVYFIVKDDR